MTQKKLILVVDDNYINRSILCRILKTEGYSTVEAENGLVALDILSMDDQAVSLVLLDISMPVMDGYTLLDRMTASGIITRVPVIVTTGADDDKAEVKCLERGASDFLKKPYNAEMVRHRIKSLLRLWDNAALISKLEKDQLTGAYSKEFFYRYCEEILNEHPDDTYYVVYADVDDFKMINARYGSATGDALLRYLAAYYRRLAGDDGIFGRIGGDIFAILIKDYPKHSQGEVDSVHQREFSDAPVKGFQLKYGVYTVKDRLLSIADMCDRAKLAVDTVKHQYSVHYAVYDDSMLEHALREHQLADWMEEALEKSSLRYIFSQSIARMTARWPVRRR